VQPAERFLGTEAGSGLLLLAAAAAALVWANVASESYDDFWATALSVEIGSLSFHEDLRHIVNDLLMAVFFFVVALEVKRELVHGELRDRATAAVPVAAALGTMVGGAGVYVAINLDGGELGGWAVPIATDIAFALAVLGIAGRRAPPQLRIFLLTLAVVDDLGTIAVIAVFFTEDLELVWLVGAAGLTAAILILQRVGVRSMVVFVTAAGLLWLAIYESGVHATIAGVLLGFLTPSVAFHRSADSGDLIGARLQELARNPELEIGQATMWDVSLLAREAVSPLARLEERVHPWSAYVILPLFALANAGVPFSVGALGDALTSQVGLGIVFGLAVGAPLGGVLLTWALTRATPTRLPDGLDWHAIFGVAPLKGIGFTVAIFIATLAFDSGLAREQATLAILVGSTISGVVGLLVLRARRH